MSVCIINYFVFACKTFFSFWIYCSPQLLLKNILIVTSSAAVLKTSINYFTETPFKRFY